MPNSGSTLMPNPRDLSGRRSLDADQQIVRRGGEERISGGTSCARVRRISDRRSSA